MPGATLKKTGDYAPTAWDSRRPRRLPKRPPLSAFSLSQRLVRKERLPWGEQLEDGGMGAVEPSYIRDLRAQTNKYGKGTETLLRHAPHNPAAIRPFSSLRSPRTAMNAIKMMALFVSIASFFAVLFTFDGSEGVAFFSWENWSFFFYPFSIFVVAALLERIMPHRNYSYLNRRTGKLVVPGGWFRRGWECRFDELDAYVITAPGKTGLHYYLHLAHRYSENGITTGELHLHRWAVNLEWEHLQRFMDTGKPLLDTPAMEPWRPLDPTTRAHDVKTGRDPHYWLHYPDAKFPELEARAREARKRVENFIWSVKRDSLEPWLCLPAPKVIGKRMGHLAHAFREGSQAAVHPPTE